MTERRELPGGATLYALESHAVPLVSITIATRTGCALDPAGRDGLLRIALRMLRRGADGLSSADIEDTIDRLGAELAIDVGSSVTTLYGQVISRNVDAFVSLLCRLLSSPTIDEAELARLLRETRAEILEARDNDRSLAERAFRRAVFAGHSYGRSSRGTQSTLEGISRHEVAQSLATHFVRGNLVLAVAGDVSVERAARLAERIVMSVPDGQSAPDVTPEPAPVQGRRLVFVDKPDRSQTQIVIGGLGTSPHDADHSALLVGNAVFGGTFTARLMKEVRSKRGWSYGASSRLNVDRARHSFSMWTFPGATDAAPCVALELDLLEKWTQGGITAREHAFVSKYLVRSFAFDIDTASKRVHQLLDEDALGLAPGYYGDYTARVLSTKLEEINAAIQTRISPRDLTIAVVGTASTSFNAVRDACGELASATTVAFDAD